MLKLQFDTPSRRPAALLLLALALAGTPACGGNKSADESPATRFCNTLSEYTTTCAAAATPCDQAMVEDCASVVGIVSDGFLQSAGDCIASGGSPLTCLAGAIVGLTPSAAQEAFVAKFCEGCAFGIGACEDVLLGRAEGPEELKAASLLILPLGDSLVEALGEQCTTGLTCLATFPTCAQGVLLDQAIPDKTVQCVLDSLTGKTPEGAPVPEDSLAACGLGGTDAGEESASNPSSPSNPGNPSDPGTPTEASGTTTGDADVSTGSASDPTVTTNPTTPSGETSTGAPDPSDSDSDPSDADTGTPPGPDMGGDTDGWDQLCAGPFSQHSECEVGGPLPDECTWCSYLVCTYFDPFCCETQWDDQCQAKALERCSMSCGASTAACAHSPCSTGVALAVSCSDCVTAVCDSKPACCDIEWDAECTTMATACGVC